MFRVAGNANFRIFRYQHVGIPNAKLWCLGSKPMQAAGANGFAWQLNIGLRPQRNRLLGRLIATIPLKRLKPFLNDLDFSFTVIDLLDQKLNIDQQWDIVYNAIKTTADILCYMKTSSYPKNKPWLSKELIKLSRNKDKALKIARKTRSDEDKRNARLIRNKCNVAFRMARRRYILDYLTEFADNPKKFWQYIRESLPKSRSQSILNLINEQNSQYIPLDQTCQNVEVIKYIYVSKD